MQPKHTPTGPVPNSSSQLNAFGNAGVGAEAQSDTTNSSANDIGASPGTNDASLFWDYGLND